MQSYQEVAHYFQQGEVQMLLLKLRVKRAFGLGHAQGRIPAAVNHAWTSAQCRAHLFAAAWRGGKHVLVVIAQEMREAILAIYLDRKNLAATLKDTKTVVGKLEMIVGVVIQMIFFFFYLIIWDVRSESCGCTPLLYPHLSKASCELIYSECGLHVLTATLKRTTLPLSKEDTPSRSKHSTRFRRLLPHYPCPTYRRMA